MKKMKKHYKINLFNSDTCFYIACKISNVDINFYYNILMKILINVKNVITVETKNKNLIII